MLEDGDKYRVYELEEYIRTGEPQKEERSRAWSTAIGLQQVDQLNTSKYLRDTALRHIEGEISISEAKDLINAYYQTEAGRSEDDKGRTEEADKVSARIMELLADRSFSMSSAQYISIHRHLFTGIYSHAGMIRDYNITKKEWVLRGETVFYSSFDTISANLAFDIQQEKDFDYKGMNIYAVIRHLTRFCSNLWQTHAFGEGNTRTTAVFMIKYLHTLGLNVNNDVFASHSWYFRNALVRANYNNLAEGVTETTVFLERFFRYMILGDKVELRNREMHLDWGKVKDLYETERELKENHDAQSATDTVQSATDTAQSAISLPPKCKNCTLDQIAVMRVIQANPRVTQRQIAKEIGLSERTVKTITIVLSALGIIRRYNGKRNGYWKIIYK